MEIDNKRLAIGLLLIFLLGVLFAWLNGTYAASTSEQLPLIVYGISFLSILVGAFIVVMFQWRISRIQLDKVLRILPRDERLMVESLLDNSGRLEQNNLVVLTGLSKVQVSRLVARLEQRGVVEKKAMGNTNLILLKV